MACEGGIPGNDCNSQRWFFKLNSPAGRTLELQTSRGGRLWDWQMPPALPANCAPPSMEVPMPAIAFTGYLAPDFDHQYNGALVVEQTCRLRPPPP